MFEKISDSLYFIRGRRFDSNSILVLSDIPFLVDTGTGFRFAELAADLKRIGHWPEAVVNTHCHFDHVGGNHYFDAPAYIHENDLPHLRDADEFTLASEFQATLSPSSPLPLPQEFHGWRVIHTPGHTQGSVCLYNGDILISGDTLFAGGYGRTDLPGGDGAQMGYSLKRLAELDYSTLLPGHGPPLRKRSRI